MDIFRRGFPAHQNHAGTCSRDLNRFLGREHHAAGGAAGAGWQAGGDNVRFLRRVDHGVQERLDVFGRHPHQGLTLGNQSLAHHVHRNLHRRPPGALAAARLQHEQLPFLHGELQVLHVAIVLLEQGLGREQLVIDVRQPVLQGRHRQRRANAGHNVFAGGVEQELAKKVVITVRGIACERHTGAGGVTEVAEHHGLHVNGRAQCFGNVVHFPVHVGARGMPGQEYRFHGKLQLDKRVFREVHQRFVDTDDFLPVFGAHVDVVGFAVGSLVLLDFVLEAFAVGLQNHIGKHLDEAPVAVIGKARVAGFPRQAFSNFVVQSQVENGIHHAGHGHRGPGTHREKQGVFRVAEARAHFLLYQVEGDPVFLLQQRRQLVAGLEVLAAGGGGNNETVGHRQAQ